MWLIPAKSLCFCNHSILLHIKQLCPLCDPSQKLILNPTTQYMWMNMLFKASLLRWSKCKISHKIKENYFFLLFIFFIENINNHFMEIVWHKPDQFSDIIRVCKCCRPDWLPAQRLTDMPLEKQPPRVPELDPPGEYLPTARPVWATYFPVCAMAEFIFLPRSELCIALKTKQIIQRIKHLGSSQRPRWDKQHRANAVKS